MTGRIGMGQTARDRWDGRNERERRDGDERDRQTDETGGTLDGQIGREGRDKTGRGGRDGTRRTGRTARNNTEWGGTGMKRRTGRGGLDGRDGARQDDYAFKYIMCSPYFACASLNLSIYIRWVFGPTACRDPPYCPTVLFCCCVGIPLARKLGAAGYSKSPR